VHLLRSQKNQSSKKFRFRFFRFCFDDGIKALFPLGLFELLFSFIILFEDASFFSGERESELEGNPIKEIIS